MYNISDGLATIGVNGTGITDFGVSGSDEVIVSIESSDGGGFEGELSDDVTGLSGFTLGTAGDFNLAPGTYEVELEYLNVVDDQTGDNFGGAEGLAGFSRITSFELEIVPEPSSFALLGGLLAASTVLLRRRR